MSGSALVLQADALRLPLPDESVDLIVSSPPYFALRSYRDGDEHYAGQIGSEPTPQAFLEALWAVMHECWRVLKPTGSCFINLGDKRSGSGGHNNSGIGGKTGATSALNGRSHTAERDVTRSTRRNAPDRYNQAAFGRPKSKMLLPHRFAIGCEDGLADPEGKGWVVRSDIVWQKLNGLPESVTDRCRDSHEYLFHLTKEPRYFAAVDEVREAYNPAAHNSPPDSPVFGDKSYPTWGLNGSQSIPNTLGTRTPPNPLGKLPGSVWPLASEPLIVSDEVKAHYDLPDHFAAFPTELVRRVILGWSPAGVCTGCGEGVRPVTTKKGGGPVARAHRHIPGYSDPAGIGQRDMTYDIGGYSCQCRTWTHEDIASARTTARPTVTTADPTAAVVVSPPVGTRAATATSEDLRPAVVLDIFGGTGTTAGVARALGRIGVSVDLSHDYSRLARWRIERSGHFAKVVNRTHKENQGGLFGVPA